MDDSHEPLGNTEKPEQPPGEKGNVSGSCFWCGHSLRGLSEFGRCPECGKGFTPESSQQLQPWPSVLTICLHLGWPIAGLAASNVLLFNNRSGMIFGWLFLLAVPINTYFTVRSLLKQSLPERTRTTGVVAVLRALGTTVCVLVVIAFIIPLIFLGGCLILLSAVGL